MRYKTSHLSTFFLLICIASHFLNTACRGEAHGYFPHSNPTIIHLDSMSLPNSLYQNVTDLKLISLDSDPNAIISEALGVQQLIYQEGKYFILDGKYMAIKVFDSTGKYLFNIGKLGLGLGEFVRIENLQYNGLHNSIMVLCNNPTKLCEYALNGDLLKETRLSFWATSVLLPSKNKRIFYVNQNKSKLSEDFNILETDSFFKIYSKLVEMPKNISATIKFSGGLFSKNEQVIFNPAFSNSYYLLQQDTFKEVYKIDYGTKNLPQFKTQTELFQNIWRYNYQLFTLFSSNKYFGFNYQDGSLSTAFYNLHTGRLLTADLKLDSLNILFRNPIFQSDDKVMIILNSDDLANITKINFNKLQEKYPSFCQNLNTADHSFKLLTFKLQ